MSYSIWAKYVWCGPLKGKVKEVMDLYCLGNFWEWCRKLNVEKVFVFMLFVIGKKMVDDGIMAKMYIVLSHLLQNNEFSLFLA